MLAARCSVLAALLCSALVVVWAGGVLSASGPDGAFPPLALGQGMAGLWLAQALCLGVLLPGCVTLWSWRQTAMAVPAFVLVPLPLWTLAWLMGLLVPVTAAKAITALLLLGAAGAVAGAGLRRGVRQAAWGTASVLVLQGAMGIAVVRFASSWLGWVGL